MLALDGLGSMAVPRWSPKGATVPHSGRATHGAAMRALIRLYPRAWRERYGDEFEAFLEDSGGGPATAADVVRGALDARLRAGDWRPAAAWVLLALGGVAIGWLNFHAADDVQPVAGGLLILGFGFGFGLHRPRRAWLFAALLALAVPVSEAWRDAAGYHPLLARPEPLYQTALALVPALAGAGGGAAVRWASGRR